MSDTVVIKDTFTPWLTQYANKPQKINAIVRRYAKKIEAEAARDAPYDTGTLQGSIAAEELDASTWEIHDGVEYGIYQELGTSRGVPARHFLGGACERNQEPFFSDIAEELSKE